MRIVVKNEGAIRSSPLAPERGRLHLLVGEAEVWVQRVEILQEALEVAPEDPQHLIVARALAEGEEELAEQFKDHWDRLSWVCPKWKENGFMYMKSLIPKGAKSMFDQNWVTNITTLFSLPPTFRMHLWSEYNEQQEDIVKLILGFPLSHRRVYKLAQRNAFFSEVTKVDMAPFGIKLYIWSLKGSGSHLQSQTVSIGTPSVRPPPPPGGGGG